MLPAPRGSAHCTRIRRGTQRLRPASRPGVLRGKIAPGRRPYLLQPPVRGSCPRLRMPARRRVQVRHRRVSPPGSRPGRTPGRCVLSRVTWARSVKRTSCRLRPPSVRTTGCPYSSRWSLTGSGVAGTAPTGPPPAPWITPPAPLAGLPQPTRAGGQQRRSVSRLRVVLPLPVSPSGSPGPTWFPGRPGQTGRLHHRLPRSGRPQRPGTVSRASSAEYVKPRPQAVTMAMLAARGTWSHDARRSNPAGIDAHDEAAKNGGVMSPQTRPVQDLNWLITNFVERVPSVAHSIVVSSDGRVPCPARPG
jgi:hypothetical protein